MLALFCGNAQNAFSRGGAPFDVTAEAEREKVNIGDTIKIYVLANLPKGFEATFPERPENTGEFNFIASAPVETGRGADKEVGRAYVMSIYTTGTHVVPPVNIEYWNTEGTERGILQSPQVPLNVESLLTGKDKDIKDIKPLMLFPISFVFVLVIFLVFVFFGAGIWVYVWKFRGGKLFVKKEVIKSPYEMAHEELMALKGKSLPDKGFVKEYYTELSDIVRHYIEGRFSYKAPEMTTEEFMEYVKKVGELEREHKGLLKDFLMHCDMVKFAKYGPTPIEMIDSFNSASNFVEQTREEEGEAKE